MRFAKPAALGIACFLLGAVVTRYYDTHRRTQPTETAKAPEAAQRAEIDFQNEPLWAYGFDRPPLPGEKALPQNPPSRNLRPDEDAVEQTKLMHLPGTSAAYSRVDVRDGQNVIDWFPNEHPPMPNVIAHGPAALGQNKRGCGSCHLPNGKGRPENAPVAGMPVAYIMRQIQDFRSGRRHSADPRKPNTNTMIELAKSLTDEELKTAAEYFGSMKWWPWVRVVETNLVPKTRIAGGMFLVEEGAGKEPIGQRIIEAPEKTEDTEMLRNSHSGFVAYVPPGSIKKGEALVNNGAGKTTQCAICHGANLQGSGPVPGIAGRSPSYLVRQLYDMQQGVRKGEWTDLMKPVVAKLTPEDMIAIVAYTASRPVGERSSNNQ